jgi:hypothetical protein
LRFIIIVSLLAGENELVARRQPHFVTFTNFHIDAASTVSLA